MISGMEYSPGEFSFWLWTLRFQPFKSMLCITFLY